MTPEERFEKYWEHIEKKCLTPAKENRALKEVTKTVAKNAFLNAMKVCGIICEGWYNHYRFGGETTCQIIDVWQTISGTHPNPEIKI